MSTAALYVFAFGSGFAALVYQVAWSRMLAMTFGSSLLAAGAVVAAFMGGMGIGAWLYHRAGDRVRVPLHAYAWLELLIVIATAGFTFVYLALPYTFAAAASWFSGGLAMDVFRFRSTTGVLVPLDDEERWSLKLGYQLDYNSSINLVGNRLPMDLTTSVSVVYIRP